jgi:hypothetical protein
MQDTWAQVEPDSIWDWIASLPNGAAYSTESVELYRVGHLLGRIHPFKRVIIVYKFSVLGLYHVLRAVPTPADIHNPDYKHNWKLPVWNPKWTMPTEPLQHFYAGDFTLDQLTDAMQRVRKAQSLLCATLFWAQISVCVIF